MVENPLAVALTKAREVFLLPLMSTKTKSGDLMGMMSLIRKPWKVYQGEAGPKRALATWRSLDITNTKAKEKRSTWLCWIIVAEWVLAFHTEKKII